jgi:peptidyl-prolyl cis-trans isomerase SurA
MKFTMLFSIRTKLILFVTLFFLHCNSSSNILNTKNDTDLVGMVGAESILYDELVEGYMSGNINQDPTSEELVEFLPIYLNYRAKLLAAKEQGYFEKSSILDEYAIYAKQAAYAFWLDQQIKPTQFQEFKSRYNEELKSSHVLIQLNQNARPEDTLAVYNTLIEARELFLSGQHTMAELNEMYSSRRNGQLMGGDLPWFSVGVTVAPFEDALYALEEGEISMPVRTQFGYHIIHLEERRERIPARSVSHIFISNRGDTERIDDLYSRLEEGTPWMDLVVEFSEDRASVSNEGNIGWVSYSSRYDQAFIDSVMALDPSLPFNKPISSVYGMHILKVDSIQQFASEEAKDAFLTKELENSSSFERNNGFVIDWISEKYGLEVNSEIVTSITDQFLATDSLLISDIPTSILQNRSDSLLTFQGRLATVEDFLSYLTESRANLYLENIRPNWFTDFQEFFVDSHLADFTLEVFPDFSTQTDSYLRGLVVYQINEDSVWSSATVDSTLLFERYTNDSINYAFDTRYYYHLISARYDSTLMKAKEFIEAGGSPDSLRANDYPVAVLSDSTGLFQGEPFTRLGEMTEGEISEFFTYKNRQAFFVLNDILPARKMTFTEAFNRVLSDYQPIREQNWLERLNKRYSIQSYPNTIREKFSD